MVLDTNDDIAYTQDLCIGILEALTSIRCITDHAMLNDVVACEQTPRFSLLAWGEIRNSVGAGC